MTGSVFGLEVFKKCFKVGPVSPLIKLRALPRTVVGEKFEVSA